MQPARGAWAAHLLLVVDEQVELVEVAVDEALAGQPADELHAREVDLGGTRGGNPVWSAVLGRSTAAQQQLPCSYSNSRRLP